MSDRCLEVRLVYSFRAGATRRWHTRAAVTQYFVPNDKPEDPRPPEPRRAAVIGFVVIVLLVALGLFLIHVLRDMSRIQDCAMQGRTNCAPDSSSPQ
jgi:hypothetical protein